MRIARKDFRWRVLGRDHALHDCLETLAYRNGYRVCEVSRRLGLTEQYFRRVFRRDVGLPVKQWMRWERMVAARRLLVRGWDPLLVGSELGFAAAGSFRREFRTVYGVSPWRFLEIRVADDS